MECGRLAFGRLPTLTLPPMLVVVRILHLRSGFRFLTWNGISKMALAVVPTKSECWDQPSDARRCCRRRRPRKGMLESAGADPNRLEVPRPTYGSVNAFVSSEGTLSWTLRCSPPFQHLTNRCGPNLTLLRGLVNPNSSWCSDTTPGLPHVYRVTTDWG